MSSMLVLMLCIVAVLTGCAYGSMRNLRGSSHQALVSFSSSSPQETCTDLQNMESYFAVNVSVGTPPQTFQLVADTGSDSIIVTSCMCVAQHYCSQQDKCFQGSDRSSTFKLSTAKSSQQLAGGGTSQQNSDSESPLAIQMTFGSGTVSAVIATDTVEVGGVKTNMPDGVLLMVDRRMLRISGPFQGILGLGPPKVGGPSHGAGDRTALKRPANWAMKTPPHSQLYAPKLFLEHAGVQRFSMCFNDASRPGAMRMNVPPFTNPLTAIGEAHWGLGLYGMSVGAGGSVNPGHAVVCSSGKQRNGQETPCGAIPDSGTTLMMGPQDQVEAIFASLCDNWDRCRRALQTELSNMTKAHAFQEMLYNCDSWLSTHSGIDEVPSIFITVGSAGKKQKLELTPWAFIMETSQSEYKTAVKHLYGVIPVRVRVPTGKMRKVCVPSFGVQDYNTLKNGPVWILGTPLFYQYNVGFDLSGPHISFESQDKCSTCDEAPMSFLASQQRLHKSLHARPLRKFSEPRVGYVDTSMPM